MRFLYDDYSALLESLEKNGYIFTDYHSYNGLKKCVILRHDVDYNLKKAIKIAELEADKGIKSTFFILLTTDFYNIYALDNKSIIRNIASMGHEIGLHFDEANYNRESKGLDEIVSNIVWEAESLSNAIDYKITTVSMHRPSKMVLEANLKISNIVNTYDEIFFKHFKYISDSRGRWREPVDEIIDKNMYNRLHILTHPFWYNDRELSIKESLIHFINDAAVDRYDLLKDNFTDLYEFVKKDSIIK